MYLNLSLYGVFTLPTPTPIKKMGCIELYGGVHTDTYTSTDAIGFQTHCVGVGAGVGKGKICVGVGQCEHTIRLM